MPHWWIKKIFGFKNKDIAENKNQTKEEENKTSHVYRFRLSSYDEVVYVAKILNKKGRVLINLNDMEKSERKRVIDFLSGVIFFQQGQIKKIKEHIYLFTLVVANKQ